jgi:hypothetical protein
MTRPREVKTVDDLASAATQIARAITADAVGGHDAFGGHVECLTEAVMGLTVGLQAIASALSDLASAVREHGDG